MKKFIIETNEPDQVNVYLSALEVKDAIWGFSQWLRDKIKHDNLSEEEYRIYTAIREELHEAFEDITGDYIR